jgi:uncharacterized membrane protein
MPQVIETVDVNVPVSTAYNQWTQFESFPKFLSYVESITQINETLTAWKVKIGGVEREFEENHAGVVTFHKLSDNETRVTVQLDWEATGLAEKAGALLGVDNHVIKKDLQHFKEFIESEGVETGSWRGDVEA